MAIRQENRLRQRKALLTVLSVVTVALVYGILLSDNGVRQYLALRTTLAKRSVHAHDRITRNRSLLERLEGLQSDKRVLEEIARSSLGVAGTDEIVYVFRPLHRKPGR